MKKAVVLILSLAGHIVLEASQSGCSLIGLAVDAGQPADTVTVDPALDELKGKTVLITLRNGERFAARCAKVGSLPMEVYRPRYLRWERQGQGRTFSLALGDTLHVAWNKGQITVGFLQGFTRGAIAIQRPGVAGGFLKHHSETLSIPVEEVDSLWTLGGKMWDKGMLQGQLDERVIPTMDALLVRRGSDAAWVSLDDVAAIAEVRHSYTWFNNGAIVDGVGLVVAVIYLATRR